MSAIPADIMKIASDLAAPRHIAPRKQDFAVEIASAILAERESHAQQTLDAERVAIRVAQNALMNEARRVGPLTIDEMAEVFDRLRKTVFALPTPPNPVSENVE